MCPRGVMLCPPLMAASPLPCRFPFLKSEQFCCASLPSCLAVFLDFHQFSSPSKRPGKSPLSVVPPLLREHAIDARFLRSRWLFFTGVCPAFHTTWPPRWSPGIQWTSELPSRTNLFFDSFFRRFSLSHPPFKQIVPPRLFL